MVHDPESLQDAKRHLIQALKNNGGRSYDRTFQRTAAQAADVNRISQKCPGFLTFVQKVKQCREQRTLFQEPAAENPH